MDPVEDVEDSLGLSAVGVTWGMYEELVLVELLDAVEANGSSSDIAGEALESLAVLGGDELAATNRETGRAPAHESQHELFRESVSFVQTGEDEPPKHLFDDRDVERWQRMELTVQVEDALGDYREGIPRVLLEAAATGLPIVTTDSPGCRDVVTHGDNGLLVPILDGQAVADAVRQLLASPASVSPNRAERLASGRRGTRLSQDTGWAARDLGCIVRADRRA